MDYRQFTVPFLDPAKIRSKVDDFRKKFEIDTLPVNIDRVIETQLRIDIIPVPSLRVEFGAEAFITSNWDAIYVDSEEYMSDKYENRLRFSFAHEIGHYILHKKIYEGFGIKEVADFYRFYRECPENQYGYLESQANMFANNLLIPRDHLVDEYKKVRASIDLPKNMPQETFFPYVAIPLSKIFGVSEKAMEIALNSNSDSLD